MLGSSDTIFGIHLGRHPLTTKLENEIHDWDLTALGSGWFWRVGWAISIQD